MRLEAVRLEALQSVPVTVNGSWSADRDWRGSARSPVPLVGMSFLQSGNHCEWCKSERDEPSPEVRLALFPYDEAALDVQVNFSVGHGGRRWRTLMPSPSCRPVLPDTLSLETGTIHRFADLDTDPAVALYYLFVARDDVESSRGTLWRVRHRLEPDLAQPFRQWLTHGRTGGCEG
jgi:hypothetical protein